jgi:ATP-dependent DNA helicase RecG
MLLFGRQPHIRIAGAYVTAARLAGMDLAAEAIDVKRIEGRLAVQTEDVLRFLRGHLAVSRIPTGCEPDARADLPEAALHEALMNALAHRDYTIAGPVRVLVLDDRVEVRSPGRLPNTVTVEAMRLGAVHVVRNATVFATLMRLGYVTDMGSGVRRMIQRVREHGGGEVRLVEEASEFVVSFPRPRPAPAR